MCSSTGLLCTAAQLQTSSALAAADLYASWAMALAVSSLAKAPGTRPPSAPVSAAVEYGTLASNSVREAPGTVSSHARACADAADSAIPSKQTDTLT